MRFYSTKVLSMAVILLLVLGMGPMTGFAAQDNDNRVEDFDDLPKTGDTFTDMETQINQLKEDEDIQDDTAHALKMHVTSIEHFQQAGKTDKVMKHIKGFKRLLDHQKEEKVMSDKAFHILHTYAEYMIGKQENPFDSDNVMEHIKQLSVNIGPRPAGSDAEKEGAAYIKEELEDYGYNTSTQEFDIRDRVDGQLTFISNDHEEVPVGVASDSPETNENGVTGKVYDAGAGQPEDFNEDMEDNVVFIQKGELSAWEQVQNATDAGAAGVIIYDNQESYVPLTPNLEGHESSIPVVGITKEDGESLLSQIAEKEMRVNVTIQNLEEQKSRNVIAVKEPEDVEDPEIVYVGSHLDSVPFAPGANDDGSGSATLLELARTFKDYDGDKELRFVAFGAEELGLVGSSYYVDHLPQEEIDRTLIQYQMDMVGTSWTPASQLFINTVDGEPNLVSETTNEAADRLGITKDLLTVHQLSRSDHVPFHEKGVDSALFIWMEPGTPDGLAGLEPYYHSPEDKIKHVSPERIQVTGDLVHSAVSDMIDYQVHEDETETNVWKDAS